MRGLPVAVATRIASMKVRWPSTVALLISRSTVISAASVPAAPALAATRRRISASALQAMAPDTLQKHARAIVLDPSDSDEVQAASLTAIEQFGDRNAVADHAAAEEIDFEIIGPQHR